MKCKKRILLRFFQLAFMLFSIACSSHHKANLQKPLPPSFSEEGEPAIKLLDLPGQIDSLHSVRVQKALRWNAKEKQLKEFRRIEIPYDSSIEPNPVRHLFRDVYKSPLLTTGILLDACPTFHTEENNEELTLPKLNEKIRQLAFCADQARTPFARFDRLLSDARAYYAKYGTIPIIMLDVDAERLSVDSFRNIMLTESLVFRLQQNQPALDRSRIFAVAPLISEVGHRKVKMVLDKRFILTNRASVPNFYAITINDEKPFEREVGRVFAFELPKEQRKFRITVSVGQQSLGGLQTSRFFITSTLVPAYDLTWIPSCHPVSSEGDDVWIRPYVFFGANHVSGTSAPEIQNPFVILGGYDQELFGNYSRMYDALTRLAPGTDLVAQLRRNFDVVLLEYSDVGVSLQLNAQALACVIRDINVRNHNRDGIMFVGISMGGLISRMTFAGMENNAIPDIRADHNVKFWATIDAPHQGAHIPLGLQLLAHKFRFLPGEEIEKTNQLLDSRAAKEMLIEHYESLGPSLNHSPGPAPERTSFLQVLESWGSFPQKIDTTVAFASGSLSYLSRLGIPDIGGRVDQNEHHIPEECPVDGGLFSTTQCVTLPEQWIPIVENIHTVQADSNIMYWEQSNVKGLGGLRLLSMTLSISLGGLNGTLDLFVDDRTIQYLNDTSATSVYRDYWEFDVLPGWVLAFIDNPSGSSTIKLAPGIPYSLMAGGWLSTPEDIFNGLTTSNFVQFQSTLITDVTGAPMP